MKLLRLSLLVGGSLAQLVVCFTCGALIWFATSGVRAASVRNEKLLGPDHDTEISEELNDLVGPTIEAIYMYQHDHGRYPSGIEALLPVYLDDLPSSYMQGRVVYDSRALYGIPFYFGFRGNYSGAISMHGWAIFYCPSSICTIDDWPGTRRIDDTWLFGHSSFLGMRDPSFCVA